MVQVRPFRGFKHKKTILCGVINNKSSSSAVILTYNNKTSLLTICLNIQCTLGSWDMFHILMYVKYWLYRSYSWWREASWLPPHGTAHSFAICHKNLAGLICASCCCCNSQEPLLLPINDRMKITLQTNSSIRDRQCCFFVFTSYMSHFTGDQKRKPHPNWNE